MPKAKDFAVVQSLLNKLLKKLRCGMWIKDKSVEPKIGQLYVVAFKSDEDDCFEHDLAYVSNAI